MRLLQLNLLANISSCSTNQNTEFYPTKNKSSWHLHVSSCFPHAGISEGFAICWVTVTLDEIAGASALGCRRHDKRISRMVWGKMCEGYMHIYIYTVQDYQSMSCLSSSWVTSIPNHPRSQYLSRLGFRKCKHESVLGRQLWLCKRYVGNFCLEGLALKHVCWSQSI